MSRWNRTTAPGTDAVGAERGAAALLVAAVLVMTLVMVLGTVRVGDAVVRRHRAQLVADVTALASAGADADAEAARRIAGANGASVGTVTVSHDGTVVVTVELDGARAAAAAVPGG